MARPAVRGKFRGDINSERRHELPNNTMKNKKPEVKSPAEVYKERANVIIDSYIHAKENFDYSEWADQLEEIADELQEILDDLKGVLQDMEYGDEVENIN